MVNKDKIRDIKKLIDIVNSDKKLSEKIFEIHGDFFYHYDLDTFCIVTDEQGALGVTCDEYADSWITYLKDFINENKCLNI